jgi:outer membrane protein TolC
MSVSTSLSARTTRETTASDSLFADTLRLKQVVKDVLRHNDNVAAARYMEQSSRAKVGPAGAWNDPMLMLGVANLPTSFDFKMDDMTMKMIGLSQRIPFAGERGLQSKAARSEAAASAEERRAVEIELTTAARSAYFDLYYQRRNLEDLKRQQELLGQVAASATAKLRVDQAGQDEVLAAQADLWRLESMILSAETGVIAAGSTLNSLRGLDPRLGVPPLATPYNSEIPVQADEWLQAASEHYPRLKKLERLSESYGFSAAASQRMRWPMLDLSVNYGLREDGPMGPRDSMVGFQAGLSLPIFAGRQQGQMARSMRAMQKSADAEAAQLWREVQANLVTLHDRAQRLSRSLTLYREQIIPAAEDAYRSALAGYANNRTSFIALLTYAGAIYRDRITANQLANELARILAEAESYTVDPAAWTE